MCTTLSFRHFFTGALEVLKLYYPFLQFCAQFLGLLTSVKNQSELGMTEHTQLLGLAE